MAEIAYIGIGSNQGDRINYLRRGLAAVTAGPDVSLLLASSIFENPPIGAVPQPDFLNAVFSIETSLEPVDLLRHMRLIEDRFGRQRTIHWGPRTLDLDLLLYGELQIGTEELSLPHPLMLERCFVLIPLCEIVSDLRHPVTGELLSTQAEALNCGGDLRRLEGSRLVAGT